jgi:hypothetical protein
MDLYTERWPIEEAGSFVEGEYGGMDAWIGRLSMGNEKQWAGDEEFLGFDPWLSCE